MKALNHSAWYKGGVVWCNCFLPHFGFLSTNYNLNATVYLSKNAGECIACHTFTFKWCLLKSQFNLTQTDCNLCS